MKRKYIELLTVCGVLLAFAAGCSKETGETAQGGDFTVCIEQAGVDDINFPGDAGSAKGLTKTALASNDHLCWSDGDKIFVNGTAAANTLTVLPFGSNATSGAVSGTVSANASGRKYCGYYPASTDYWTVSASAKQLKIPAAQTYNASSPMSNVPLYAESDDKFLTFRSLCGLLEFVVTGSRTVKSIKVTADQNIYGTFTLNANGGVTYSASGGKSVTLSSTTGVKASDKGGTRFYIPVPEGTYSSFKVELTTAESADWGGEDFNGTISGTFKITRGTIFQSSFSSEPMAVQLWDGGPFIATVDIGAKSPTENGIYLEWGATEKQYTKLTGTTFTFGSRPESATKYPTWDATKGFNTVNIPYRNSSGTFNKEYYNKAYQVLDREDDMSSVHWGGNWRFAYDAERVAMQEQCYMEEVTYTSDKSGTSAMGFVYYKALHTNHKGICKRVNGKYYRMVGKIVNTSADISVSPVPGSSAAYTYSKSVPHVFFKCSGFGNGLEGSCLDNGYRCTWLGDLNASGTPNGTMYYFLTGTSTSSTKELRFDGYDHSRHYGFPMRPVLPCP